MTAFRFRLQRVLQLRESQLKTEEFKLEQLLQLRAQMQAAIDAAVWAVEKERQSIESETYSTSAQWLAFESFRKRAERERQQALQKLTAHDEAIEKQRAAVVEAKRAVLLLEKLQEKRRADWQIDADKEMEELTADFSAAQWLRAKRA